MVATIFSDKDRVYLDANVFIYLVEADTYPAMRQAVTQLFSACDAGHIIPVTSTLTLAEVLPVPLRQGDNVLVQIYRGLLTTSPVLEVKPVSLSILDAAAVIRSQTSIKLPDAIHIATALQADCAYFVSNDQGLKLPKALPIQWISLTDILLAH